MLGSTARVLFVVVIMASAQAVAVQQQASPGAMTAVTPEEMKALLQRIQNLEGQVTDLKTQISKLSIKADNQPEPSPSPVPEQDTAQAMPMPGRAAENGSSPKLLLRGYADIGWNASDLKGSNNSFALGQFNLFITSRLTDKASVLSETVIEADQSTNEFGVDLERLELIYAVNDHLNLQFGRFHTAIGYYNTAYHHSAFMQTTLNRPFLFAFEDGGGILPVHSVGMSATGIVSSRVGLHYIAEIGNGRNPRTDVNPVQNVSDDNNGKAFNLGFFVRPNSIPGLQVGFSNYHDHVTPPGKANVTENILAAHFIYQNSRVEFLNEAVLLRHTNEGSAVAANTPGFYSQISRGFGAYRPYFRYEYVNVPNRDPLYSDVALLHGPKVGMRYEVNDFTSFKLEYGRTLRRGLGPVNSLGTQLAFEF
ncbi:MAG TPA: hypothetical protein VGK24_21060 [Candidatus Angelobacter sp.]|jgi:hypothetical protein